MRAGIALIAAIGSLAVLSTAAQAESSVSFQITAHVDTFCRISLPSEQQINLVNGAADIGVVHEICNTPNGYDVLAAFSNVAGGELNIAGQNYTIDQNGRSLRQSMQPRVQNVDWRIADANVVQQSTPVIMRVTITPH